MEREIAQVKAVYPLLPYVGVADGAKDHWSFLEQHTQKQNLDFYHVTGYLKAAAYAAYPRNKRKRHQWINDSCHTLKHQTNGAAQLLMEMKF